MNLAKLSDIILPNPGYGVDEDIRRIIDVPLQYGITPEMHKEIDRCILNAKALQEGESLFYDQACAINEYLTCRGGFFPIGVGFGKTGVSLIVANLAYTRTDDPKRKILLLVPPRLKNQLLDTDIAYWRYMTPIQYPIHAIIGKEARMRKTIANSGRPGLYIMSYSQLSNKDGEHIIESIEPNLIILDEAHNINSKKHSTRSSRILKYLNKKENTELVAMSGTMTSKSIMEYRGIVKHALKDYAFLPKIATRCKDWADIIDADVTKEGDYDRGASSNINVVRPLLHWYNKVTGITLDNSVSSIRRAYQYRLSTTPGCHSTGDRSIPTSLTICNTEANIKDYGDYPGMDKLIELTDKVDKFMEAPTGERIDYAIHKWKWMYELWGSGFYNKSYWPTPEVYAKNNKISIAQAQDLLSKAQYHEQVHRLYEGYLRKYLSERALSGADSPMLVGKEFSTHGVSRILRGEGELYDLWMQSKQTKFDGMPKKYEDHVRICDFKIVLAVLWAEEVLANGEGGIIWFHHRAVGEWIKEYLRNYNIPHKFYSSWSSHPDNIADKELNKGKLLVASYNSFGTGINLQFLTRQLFLQFPRPAKIAEQTIGRLHRSGQAADELFVDTLNMSIWDHMNFAATLNDALYVHQSLNTRQKLIYAGYDPLPFIFPPHVLDAQGAEVKKLNSQELKTLQSKFGEFRSLQEIEAMLKITPKKT